MADRTTQDHPGRASQAEAFAVRRRRRCHRLVEEDYGPDWLTVAELKRGTFENEGPPGVVFDAKPVTGRRRDEV